jgi:hypothetical protein
VAKTSYTVGKGGKVEPHNKDYVSPVPSAESRAWKTELDRELIENLVSTASTLAFKKAIALANGVKPDLFEWWLAEGMREDAPELMQELSVRIHSVQALQNAVMVDEVRKAAARGDWQAAATLLRMRDQQWSGKMEQPEKDSVMPELSQTEKRKLMIEALKNPKGDMAAAMKEALEDPNSGLLKLLEQVQAKKALPSG